MSVGNKYGVNFYACACLLLYKNILRLKYDQGWVVLA